MTGLHFNDVSIGDINVNELLEKNDNKELVEEIFKRLQFGFKKYNTGIQVDNDTRQYHTAEDSWLLMAMEETLDQILYTAASLIRIRRELTNRNIQN